LKLASGGTLKPDPCEAISPRRQWVLLRQSFVMATAFFPYTQNLGLVPAITTTVIHGPAIGSRKRSNI
jgi:hypothetical protein